MIATRRALFTGHLAAPQVMARSQASVPFFDFPSVSTPQQAVAIHRRMRRRPLLLSSGEIIVPTRRGAITGLSSMAAAFALCPRPVAGASKFADYFSALSAKDPTYGATGNGTTDDRAAIQACFDAAFGASPGHGNANKFLNKAVYFPAGNYKVGAPLYLNNVFGGHVFGDASLSTRLFYSGAFSGNSVAVSTGGANAITPLLMTDGWNYSLMEGLNLAMTTDNNSVAFYLYGNTSSCNANTFRNIAIEGPNTDGMLIGYESPSTAVSECLYINVTFALCGLAGLRVIGANTLNHWVYGGGAASCGNNPAYSANNPAGYSCVTGSIPIMAGGGHANNIWDIYNNGAIATSISGVRTESLQFAQLTTGNFHLSGCIQDQASATKFAQVDGTVVMDACNSGGTAAVISGSGNLYLRGCTFANANVVAAFGGMVKQNI